MFSYIDFRLERPPFSLHASVAGLVFLVWAMGAAGPAAGRIAGARGWRPVSLGGLVVAAAGAALSLAELLPLVLVGLAPDHARQLLGRDGGAARRGVVDRDQRGLASALYFSAYYVAGALGGYLPGLAFERWEWPGVAALALAAYATGIAAIAFIGRRRGA